MLMWVGTAALATLVAVPVLAALTAAVLGRRSPVFTARLGAAAAGAGFLVSVGLAWGVARGGVALVGSGVWAVAADQLAVAALLLVFGVSAVVQVFAVRYLAGDRRAAWFTAGAGLLTAASAVLVTATTLVGIAAGWSAAGLALCLLLGMYWQLPSARDGVRRAATAFLIGDGALWAAVALIGVHGGTVALAELHTVRLDGALAPAVSVLVVVAALSRSAQIPFHRWLPATLAAPTPVSALLHAGVVNAGGIVLIRLSPLPSPALAAALLVTAGALSMIYGGAIVLVKPDVKGSLAHSTMAQMGFMIFTCGLGLWAAAVLHLIAHGFYKATLFLSSGSVIARGRRRTALPSARRLTGRHRLWGVATAAILPLAALVAATRVVPLESSGHAAHALLVFAWVTGAAATWGWLQRRPHPTGALSASAVLLPSAIGYVAVVGAVTGFLTPSLPATPVPSLIIWAVVAATVTVLGALAGLRASPTAAGLQRTLYTRALSAGTIHPTTTGAHR